MRLGNVIASTVVLVWGAAIIVVRLLQSSPAGQEEGAAYGAGQNFALVFAAALAIAGGRGLYREISRARAR